MGPEPPRVLRESPRFQIRECLGVGGFGVVYSAFDRERNAEVALKWLRRADPSLIARFKREFRALAEVDHPNLIRLRDLVALDDDWFFTMDLVDGVDLLHYVRPQHGVPRRASVATAEAAPVAAGARTTASLPRCRPCRPCRPCRRWRRRSPRASDRALASPTLADLSAPATCPAFVWCSSSSRAVSWRSTTRGCFTAT